VLNLKNPNKLSKGDKVATVSLSWGGAGDENLLWRYNLGKQRLQEEFGLEVIEMPNTLKGTDYIYNHPEKRAEDLMAAFKDKTIDFDVIRDNPKVFIGYSDTTISHFMCLKAGISSFYGASILAEFAENIKVFDYTKEHIQKVLFNNDVIGEINPCDYYTSERIAWEEINKNTPKNLNENCGHELLQGSGKVQGRLIGGCIEVLEMMKGTILWNLENFEDAILFIETSEDMTEPTYIEYWLRNYGSQGILQKLKGIIWGKPYNNKYYEEYKEVIQKVIHNELNLKCLPILYNMNFGHTEPMACLPYGALAEIDCNKNTFSILEAGVK
jgi:muramoyltetrapeptide carboxypeptidase LdcA involved in peptidoglycan recycling